jgi:hypothetical protein
MKDQRAVGFILEVAQCGRVADGVRGGEVLLGSLENSAAATAKLVKLAAKYQRLTFCYEAGPTGYGLYRQIKILVPSVSWLRRR